MNPFDKILKSSQSITTQSTGGYFDDIPTSKGSTSKTSFISKAFGFVKDVGAEIKRPVDRVLTNVVQAGQVATKLPEIIKTGKATFTPMTPFTYKGQPVQPVGTRTSDFGATPENLKRDLLDIGGTGLEFASYLGLGPSTTAGKTVLKKGTQTLLRSATEGTIGGFTQGLGSQMQNKAQTGEDIKWGEVGKSTLFGGVAAPVINVLSRGVGKVLSKGEKEVVEDVFVAPKLTKEEKYQQYLQSQGYEPISNKLPEIKMGPKAKPSMPTIEYGKTQPKVATVDATVPTQAISKEPLYKEANAQIPAANIINSPEDVDRVLSGIMRDGKKAPELAEQAAKVVTHTEQVLPQHISKEVFEKADDIVENMPESSKMTPFERQKNVEQMSSIMSRPQDEIINIVKGNVDIPDEIPRDAYLAVAKNIADDMSKAGDSSLAFELVPYVKNISGKTGQALQSNKIARADNIVDVLDDVQEVRFSQLSKDAKLRYNKDLDEAIQAVQQEFEKIKGLPNTREQIVEALSKLIC